MTEWTNERAIARWSQLPRDLLTETAENGDFCKQHLVNPVLLRLLGDVTGRRILDAGCGNGYLSRMLANRGAHVTGAEPAAGLLAFCAELEQAEPLGIAYVQADLGDLPSRTELGEFDAVVASMVLPAVPDWTSALAGCVSRLRSGGRLIFSLNHPCFEQLAGTWRQHGAYQLTEYLASYAIEQRYATDFHRPLSAYLNETIRLGLRIAEVAEPGLDPAVAASDPAWSAGEAGEAGEHPYVHLPNFLIVAADLA